MRRPPAVLPALALVLAAACGGDQARLERAELLYRTGQLDGAEVALAELDGPRAQALRIEILARRASRWSLQERLAELEAGDPEQALAELGELLRDEADPVAREWIESAQSAAYDRKASGLASRRHDAAEFHRGAPAALERAPSARSAERETADPAPGDGTAMRAESVDAELLEDVLRQVRGDREAREWARALANLELALPRSGERVGELRELRDELLELADAEAQELIARAERIEDEAGLEAAHALFTGACERFPGGPALERLREEARDLGGRIELRRMAEADAGGAPSPPPTARVDGGAAARGLAAAFERARVAEGEGDLALAVDAWLDAALEHPPGSERDAAIARAGMLERRLALRGELAEAIARDPQGFAELGLRGGDARTLVVGDEVLSWAQVELELLKRAAQRARLSEEAQLGFLAERLERGDAEGPRGALAEAGRLAERGVLSDAAAWALVAAHRGEPLPEGGYVFADGAWVARAEHEAAALVAVVGKLEKKLARATAEDREAALEELTVLGEGADPAIHRALRARWEAAQRSLQRGSVLDQLERLADQRRELDRRREDALELIFDEEQYFYPYRPPEVDPDKARLYWPVQQRVDELVARVRETWAEPRQVKLSSSWRAALDDCLWTWARGEEHELELAISAELPTWLVAIDPGLATVALADFAWTTAEREQLAYSRAVRARNERLWSDLEDLPEEQHPGSAEAQQVRVTNDYREMLGRRALAWNPRIQEAARMHSEYMANTGDFGHFEPTPERRTPGDRMRLAGYPLGVSENCHMGGGDPRGAHDGWRHSSGHHRNLLNAHHREMASALASRYWTQNFGADTDFVADLEAWQD